MSRYAVLLGLCLGAGLAGCESSSSDSLKLVSIQPAEGTPIDSSTKFTVTLQYQIHEIGSEGALGEYQIYSYIYRTDGTGTGFLVGRLGAESSGRATFSFRIPENVLKDDLQVPYSLYFQAELDEGSGVGAGPKSDLAATDEVSYLAK